MILRKTKLIVYLAVAFSFLASLSVFLYLRGMRVESPVSTEPYQNIVVMAADVKAGSRLTAEQVELIAWPERLVPSGSFDSPDDVIDKVVARDFVSGEPVLAAHMARDGTSAGLASRTPPGMRAMTVSVGSNVLNDDFIKANSRVDVLATIKTERNKKGEGGYVTKSILQNVTVLSVNDGSGGRGGFMPGGGASVTLLVKPEDAERLALAGSQGVLSLVLRNIADQDPLVTTGATIASLIGGDGARPAVLPPASVTPSKPSVKKAKPTPVKRTKRPPKVRIEVIRGMEREEMVFDNP